MASPANGSISVRNGATGGTEAQATASRGLSGCWALMHHAPQVPVRSRLKSSVLTRYLP